jgi:signal transduction protein with GAF and PtsI domain
MQFFNEDQVVNFLENFAKDEETFIQKVARAEPTDLIALHDNLKALKTNHRSNFLLILRMKRIIKAANSLTASLPLNDALKRLAEECCAVLECDKTSVFMVDHEKEELWSKVFTGSSSTIRIPMSKGIIGHVATKGESLNIADAYQDHRFNKEVDLKTNYKTNTILCVPIVEESNQIIGVIQAINKIGGSFTKDDEGILSVLASLAAIVLRNSINFDQQSVYQKSLRHALKVTRTLPT